jgi:hypothetical protein
VSKKKESGRKKLKNVNPTKKFFNPRVRGELWDVDYLDQLGPEELEYYNKFMNEWANANVKKVKDPLIEEYSIINQIGYKRAKKEMIGGGYKPIKKEGKPTKGHIHRKKEHVQQIFDDNNKRNNDVFGVTKINNLLEYDLAGLAMRKDVWHETDPQATENALIEAIDYKKNPKEDLGE